MAIVNAQDKMAAKAALGLLVATRGLSPHFASEAVEIVAAQTGMQLGDLSTIQALSKYAYGVREKGEKVSNRKWSQYPGAVQQAARVLANKAQQYLTENYS